MWPPLRPVNLALPALTAPSVAQAHAAEMGFVLLLPTGLYIKTGVWVVALTALALALAPPDWLRALFAPRRLWRPRAAPGLRVATSCASAVVFAALVWAGLTGPPDPLANPLPLMIWTGLWTGALFAAAVFGDFWRWLNPWTGPAALIAPGPAPFRLPHGAGRWPGVLGLIAFSAFALADPAPADPARLATVAGGYYAFTLAGCVLFGARDWLTRAEFLSMAFAAFAEVAPLSEGRIAPPGWRIAAGGVGSASAGVFALTLLAVGAFDGLNETFAWLAIIDVNPLMHPGRSAVAGETVAGLLGFTLAVPALFLAALALGRALGGPEVGRAFAPLALSVLPIAVAYHFAHYLTSFLVDGQWLLAALSDPLARGDDLLGLGRFYVTTSFFNARDTVRAILLAQVTAIVAGHVLSILIAHRIALRLTGDARRAALSQAPLALAMIGLTFLGLWLLAAPKGG